jgi:hypothetical protein
MEAQSLLSRRSLGTTALLITDKEAAEVQPAYDVDAIAEIHFGWRMFAYIAAEIAKLFITSEFLDALPGYLLPDQTNHI